MKLIQKLLLCCILLMLFSCGEDDDVTPSYDLSVTTRDITTKENAIGFIVLFNQVGTVLETNEVWFPYNADHPAATVTWKYPNGYYYVQCFNLNGDSISAQKMIEHIEFTDFIIRIK